MWKVVKNVNSDSIRKVVEINMKTKNETNCKNLNSQDMKRCKKSESWEFVNARRSMWWAFIFKHGQDPHKSCEYWTIFETVTL